jgi:hypothetical protein
MAAMQDFDIISNKRNSETSLLKLGVFPLTLTECCIVVVIAVAFGDLKSEFSPEEWLRSMMVSLISLSRSRVMLT